MPDLTLKLLHGAPFICICSHCLACFHAPALEPGQRWRSWQQLSLVLGHNDDRCQLFYAADHDLAGVPQVGIYAGTDLAAKLTNGWLPVGKYTPLSEASMRQRGYEVQMLPLNSTASVVGAMDIYPYLPRPNNTAFQLVLNVCPLDLPADSCPDPAPMHKPVSRTLPDLSYLRPCICLRIRCGLSLVEGLSQVLSSHSARDRGTDPLSTRFDAVAQISGPVVVPFNVQKQTALLSVMARNFPRLSIGVGPVQTHVASVVDDAANQTAQVTLITVSNGSQQGFAQVRRCRPAHDASWNMFCLLSGMQLLYPCAHPLCQTSLRCCIHRNASGMHSCWTAACHCILHVALFQLLASVT